MGKKYTVGCKQLDTEGKGIVSFNGRTFSVPFFLDGEKGTISLVYGRNETTARMEEILKASPDRVNPECPYYMQCGGCDLMHMTYEKQLLVKQGHVLSALSKRIEADKPEILPMLSADEPFRYRNKIHSTFAVQGGKVVGGLYAESTHRLMPLPEGCRIEPEEAAKIVRTICRFADSHLISVYDEDRRKGILRHVLIRISSGGDIMVVPVVAEKIFPKKRALAEAIVKNHPAVKTIVLNYNPAATTMVLGEKEEVLFGEGYITETLCGCTFRISPRSFFQVNTKQAEKLFATAVTFAGIKEGEQVIDAYCGTGTIGILAAKSAPGAVITGVELNEEAVRDARSNAERNGLKNASFVCADAGKYLSAAAAEGKKADVLFLDPPRSGSTPEFLKAVSKIRPERIVYISCNPDTLARDLELLKGYKLTKVCAADMFCQCRHVESIVLLNQRRQA